MFCSNGDLIIGRSRRFHVLPPLFVGGQSSLDEDVVQEDVDHDVVPSVDLTSRLLAELSTRFAFSASPALLHQHFNSTFFFVVVTLLFPTQSRFSWIPRITFIVFGDQFSVIHDFSKSLLSIAL